VLQNAQAKKFEKTFAQNFAATRDSIPLGLYPRKPLWQGYSNGGPLAILQRTDELL